MRAAVIVPTWALPTDMRIPTGWEAMRRWQVCQNWICIGPVEHNTSRKISETPSALGEFGVAAESFSLWQMAMCEWQSVYV